MSNRNIKEIPSSINTLSNLEIFDIRETSIQELPNNIFKLSKIKKLYLENASNSFRIMNFANSPIDYCYFGSTAISYYQPDTCKNVNNNQYYHNDDDLSNLYDENNKNLKNDSKNSKDCKNLKEFLILPSNTNCCNLEDMVTCDEDNNIEKLHLAFDYDNKIDFSKFPIMEKLNELEIYSANLNTLPSVLFDLPNLQILNINKSKISEISNEINPKCPLEFINLSDNYIKNFPYQFEVLSNLKMLNLVNNNITEALQNDLLKFSSLENLFIDNNHFTGELIIPKRIKKITANKNRFSSILMDPNDSLQTLELQGNNFNGDIFNSLIHFKNLKYLDLSYNKKIRDIPPSIKKLNNLEYLDLREINIKSLPDELFELPSLNKLYLESSSQLYKIHNFNKKENSLGVDCFFGETPLLCYEPNSCNNIDNNQYKNCNNIDIIEMEHQLLQSNANKISQDCKLFNTFVNKPLNSDCCEEFGVSCDQNNSIIKLYLNNDIDSIIHYYINNMDPIGFNSFPKFQNLEKLEINNIKLNSIPNAFFQLPKLKKLLLNNNKLTGYLPNEFKNFPSLEELNLNGNELSGELIIPKTVKFIFAEDNSFSYISDIYSNSSLQKLYLSGNNFNGNVFNTLGQFKDLIELNLNYNIKIENIPSTIKNLTKLKILKLKGINIDHFPNELFSLPSLNDIQIDSNHYLNAKILKFYNSPEIMCDFGNIDILCYQPNSCLNISINIDIKPCYEEENFENSQLNNYNNNINNTNSIGYDDYLNNNNNIDYDDYLNNNNANLVISGISNGIITEIGIDIFRINNGIINKTGNIENINNDTNDTNLLGRKNNTVYKNGKMKELKSKNKNKNDKDNDFKNKFLYIVISLVCINGIIIIILGIICFLSYRKPKEEKDIKKIDDNNADADIIISEKFTIFTKEDIKREETLLLKNNKDMFDPKDNTKKIINNTNENINSYKSNNKPLNLKIKIKKSNSSLNSTSTFTSFSNSIHSNTSSRNNTVLNSDLETIEIIPSTNLSDTNNNNNVISINKNIKIKKK